MAQRECAAQFTVGGERPGEVGANLEISTSPGAEKERVKEREKKSQERCSDCSADFQAGFLSSDAGHHGFALGSGRKGLDRV
jgi:hypothetical protein